MDRWAQGGGSGRVQSVRGRKGEGSGRPSHHVRAQTAGTCSVKQHCACQRPFACSFTHGRPLRVPASRAARYSFRQRSFRSFRWIKRADQAPLSKIARRRETDRERLTVLEVGPAPRAAVRPDPRAALARRAADEGVTVASELCRSGCWDGNGETRPRVFRRRWKRERGNAGLLTSDELVLLRVRDGREVASLVHAVQVLLLPRPVLRLEEKRFLGVQIYGSR